MAALVLDLRRHLLAPRVIDIGDDDGRSFCGERKGGCPADAGAGPGHDGDLSCQLVHLVLPSLRLAVGSGVPSWTGSRRLTNQAPPAGSPLERRASSWRRGRHEHGGGSGVMQQLRSRAPEAQLYDRRERMGADDNEVGVDVSGHAEDGRGRGPLRADAVVDGMAGSPERRSPALQLTAGILIPAHRIGMHDPLRHLSMNGHRGDPCPISGQHLVDEVDRRPRRRGAIDAHHDVGEASPTPPHRDHQERNMHPMGELVGHALRSWTEPALGAVGADDQKIRLPTFDHLGECRARRALQHHHRGPHTLQSVLGAPPIHEVVLPIPPLGVGREQEGCVDRWEDGYHQHVGVVFGSEAPGPATGVQRGGRTVDADHDPLHRHAPPTPFRLHAARPGRLGEGRKSCAARSSGRASARKTQIGALRTGAPLRTADADPVHTWWTRGTAPDGRARSRGDEGEERE